MNQKKLLIQKFELEFPHFNQTLLKNLQINQILIEFLINYLHVIFTL